MNIIQESCLCVQLPAGKQDDALEPDVLVKMRQVEGVIPKQLNCLRRPMLIMLTCITQTLPRRRRMGDESRLVDLASSSRA